jgi:maltokinase
MAEPESASDPSAQRGGTAYAPPPELAALLDSQQLRTWLAGQRWYASKTLPVSAIEMVEHVQLADDPSFVVALAQARFAHGTHALYQLPLGITQPGAARADGAEPLVAESGGAAAFDAVRDPDCARRLIALIDAGEDRDTPDGRFSFRHVEGSTSIEPGAHARVVSGEQSNSSIVFADRIVLKVFRKLEPGINPELEMLRFLTARGFPNIAALHGWYEYEGAALAATLGVAQQYVPDGADGWELALAEIPDAPQAFLDRVGSLGTATAQLHNALASDATDVAFSPQEPSQEALALLSATIDEDIERVFIGLPDDPRLEAIAGRGEDVRARLAARTQIGARGLNIRIHGDFHLGQTLLTPRGWVILDFEGEPARPLPERRVKRSPLRDVASMLRSFAYATAAVELQRGRVAPEGLEPEARARFLEHYLAAVDSALLPGGEAAINNLLAIYELEKAIYELRYELNNRPDWVAIPVAGILRILEAA